MFVGKYLWGSGTRKSWEEGREHVLLLHRMGGIKVHTWGGSPDGELSPSQHLVSLFFFFSG